MSSLNYDNITIYDAMQNIKNDRYVMPAFQRQYVWSMEQIEKLWDSILLDYPISSFLLWHIDDSNSTPDTYFCNFLREVTFDSRKQSDSLNYELSCVDFDITDTAVLDGQQRLTSLYISLFGEAHIRPKHARKQYNVGIFTKLLIELNKKKLSSDEDEYNSKTYDIRFSEKLGKMSPTQFEIKRILEPEFMNTATRADAIEKAILNVPSDSKDYARGLLEKLCSKVYEEKLIHYTYIRDMNQEDALEMFVRFNSGGKALRKSDITMSILEAYWPRAKTAFGFALKGAYEKFGYDFIIRTALMLYGDVVKSNINKKIAEELKDNWKEFAAALDELEQLLSEMNIDVRHFCSSWNVLLPIIYCIYYNPDYKACEEGIRAYLIRAVLFTYFQSGTTSKLQQMKNNINDFDCEITIDMLEQMNELRVTDGKIEDILSSEKSSRIAGEALYYLSLDWINSSFKYEIDHLHPYNRFDGSKPASVPIEEWRVWRNNRNRLPNLSFLAGRCNASKSDMRLADYYNDMTSSQKDEFRKQAMIPDDVSLEFEKFGEFYLARKSVLKEKIRDLLGK